MKRTLFSNSAPIVGTTGLIGCSGLYFSLARLLTSGAEGLARLCPLLLFRVHRGVRAVAGIHSPRRRGDPGPL